MSVSLHKYIIKYKDLCFELVLLQRKMVAKGMIQVVVHGTSADLERNYSQ